MGFSQTRGGADEPIFRVVSSSSFVAREVFLPHIEALQSFEKFERGKAQIQWKELIEDTEQ